MKSNRNYAIFLSIALMLLALRVFQYGFLETDFLRNMTFNPRQAAEKAAGDGSVTEGYRTDGFELYFVEKDGVLAPYAYFRRFGIWSRSYPANHNTQGITEAGSTLYYYWEEKLNDGEQVVLLTPEGERIEPLLLDNGNGGVLPLYAIENYKKNPGHYRFAAVGPDGTLLPEKTDAVTGGRITVYRHEGDPEQASGETLSAAEWEALPDGRRELPALLREAAARIDQSRPFSEPLYVNETPTPETVVGTVSNLESYLTVEAKKKPYAWTRRIQYRFELAGQNPDTVMVHEIDYRSASLYDKPEGTSTAYAFEIPAGLKTLVEEFYAP